MAPYDSSNTPPPRPSVVVVSPKLTVKEKRASLYPYYAGYSEAFVESVFDLVGVDRHSRVLDPWNGCGTTTYVAATRGALGSGVDVNPVLSSVAIARSANQSAVRKAQAAMTLFLGSLDGSSGSNLSALESIARARDRAISNVPAGRGSRQAQALIEVIFFRAVRELSGAQRTANPAWFRSGSTFSETSFASFPQRIIDVSAAVLSLQAEASKLVRASPTIYTADFQKWRGFRKDTYDYVVTSPPYLTRLDYVMATYPELMYNTNSSQDIISSLRREMLGTPITAGWSGRIPKSIGGEAVNVLDKIRTHASKASSTYYYRFYSMYLVGLYRSISRISESLKVGGRAVVVVQSSHYKELFIDLAAIVLEMGRSVQLMGTDQFDFPQTRSMVSVNSRAIGYSSEFNLRESVVIMTKRAGQ